jgi:hypothetical protein
LNYDLHLWSRSIVFYFPPAFAVIVLVLARRIKRDRRLRLCGSRANKCNHNGECQARSGAAHDGTIKHDQILLELPGPQVGIVFCRFASLQHSQTATMKKSTLLISPLLAVLLFGLLRMRLIK